MERAMSSASPSVRAQTGAALALACLAGAGVVHAAQPPGRRSRSALSREDYKAKDMLQRGEGTEYIIDSIDFDVEVPDHMLTKAALRR